MNVQNEKKHQVWGSLAARSEALSEESEVAIHDEQNSNGCIPSTHTHGVSETSHYEQQQTGDVATNARNMTSRATDGRTSSEVGAIKSAVDSVALGAASSLMSHSDPALDATHDPWNFLECRSYGISRLVAEQATHVSVWPKISLKFISLRQWIEAALDFIGTNNGGSADASSSAYLAAALRIAISLAKQVDVAERFASNGLFDKLELFPIGTDSDWADCVRVRLKASASCKPETISAEQKPLLWEDVAAVEDVNIDQLSSWLHDSTAEDNVELLGSWDDDEWQDSHLDLAIGNANGIIAARGENKTAQKSDAKLESFFEPPFVDAVDKSASHNYRRPDRYEDDQTSFHYKGPELNALTNSNSCKQDRSWAEEILLNIQPLTFPPNAYKTLETTCKRDSGVCKEQLKFILDFFDVDDFDMTLTGLTSDKSDESNFSDTNVSMIGQDTSCLNVYSAEIQCPGGDLSNDFNGNVMTVQCRMQRIYRLGLVFYEIFSGGRKPPPEALDLSSTEGAFISLPTLNLSEGSGNHKDSKWESEHSKRQAVSSQGIEVCQLSFESLKLMGLPGPLCHLILNMLDCIHGDLSGNECYTTMVDVSSDLQLMIDKPHKFLQDLDMGKLTMSGLQMNETVIPREDEFESIKSCYHRSVLQSYEIAVIAGEPGTGKSSLAHRIGRFVAAQGGLLLSGKFDQMQQVKPFSVLATAFDQCCDVLIRDKESDWAQLVVRNLSVALGPDASHLIRVIPKLCQILPHSLSFGYSVHYQNSVHGLRRLCYLLCEFVDVICSFSAVPVILYLDDVQWADDVSLLVLNHVLIKAHKNFFFFACCRDVEMGNSHPFWNLIDNVRAFGINATIVKVNCMKKDTLNEMVSDLLCLPPRVVRSLSDIVYSKTKGNPLFFSQFMLSLTRDGLLSLSLCRQRWVWNEEEIESRKLPDDVALYFIRGISRLPLEVQLALLTLSMFGASVKYEYMEALESHLNAHLLEPLKIAAAEGFVTNFKGSFHFCHDRIQEAAYGMINREVRCRDHLKYGRCLVMPSLNSGDNEMLFVAVNQINLGGPEAVSNVEDHATLTEYNLIAGKRSMDMSDFSSAYKFFSHGMAFLPHNHWQDYYQLSLELFELASKAALATGNLPCLRIFSENVLQNASCFEDRLDTFYVILSSLAYASKVSEAFEKACAIISQLGEIIPSNLSEESSLQHHIEQTQEMVRGISQNDLLSHQLMTDKRKLAAMKFLAQLENISYMVQYRLHPFVASKMVQLTISHGLSPMSPIGFAYFGSIVAKLGNIRMGHQLTLLAKSLLDRLGAKEVVGEVICVVAQMQCFFEPMQSANELHIQGESASMRAGDVHWACLNRMLYCTVLFWAGANLSTLDETMSKACRFMREQQHKTSLIFILTGMRTILVLMGRETEALTYSELSRSVQENKNPRQLVILSFHDLYMSFLLNNDSTLMEHAEIFFQLESRLWLLLAASIGQTFIAGLASFRIYRKTSNSLWAERGKQCKADMKLWADKGSSWNIQQKLLLLQAEESYSFGNFEEAHEPYVHAISSAKSHKFINDEAIACELAAKFYLDIGDSASAMEHFHLAHQKYLEWGAVVKAERLFEETEKIFTNFLSVPDSQSKDNMCKGR